jgi:uridine kinase
MHLREAAMKEVNNMRDAEFAGRFLADTISCRLQAQAAPLIVAVSGIDASGKSTIARRAVQALAELGINAAIVSVDHWHNPPEKRFSAKNSGEHFYQNAFRFDELFRILIRPLRRLRELQVTIGLSRMPGDNEFRHTYDFRGVDVVIVEGIFLLKREFRGYFDMTFWIECSYQTALARALQRNQEAQSGAELLRDYQQIYFAAQKIHREKDAPREHADVVIENDRAAMAASPAKPAAADTATAQKPLRVPSRLAGFGLRAKELELFDLWRFGRAFAELECT